MSPDRDVAELLHQALEPLQRQLGVVHELVESERRLQRDLTGRILGPVDAVFDLLAETSTMLERQAVALATAGAALTEAAALMRAEAVLVERAVTTLRTPVDVVKSTVHLESSKPAARKGRKTAR